MLKTITDNLILVFSDSCKERFETSTGLPTKLVQFNDETMDKFWTTRQIKM